MSKLARALVTGALVIAAASLGALAWSQYASAGSGGDEPQAVAKNVDNVKIGKADATDATDIQCTSGTTFVEIPGITEVFKQGGTASKPAIVLFEGEFQQFANASTGALVRLTLDGVPVPGPGDGTGIGPTSITIAKGQTTIGATHGFNFSTGPVAPGMHTLRVEWRSDTGLQICIDERSLVVFHS